MFVENQFPADPRVKREADTLVAEGYQVAVVSLKDEPGDARYEVVDGIHVYRIPEVTIFRKTGGDHPSAFMRVLARAVSTIGYFVEYNYFTLGCAFLSLRILFRHGFDVIHVHNPPDTFFPIGAFYKLLGKKYIFDHHDLSAELYRSRYGAENDTVARILTLLEICNLKLANAVIATNESYKEIEVARGGIAADKVFVVRNGPNLKRVYPREPDAELRARAPTIMAYIGALNPQDGVDYLLRALRILVHDRKRTDFYCVVMGSGDSLDELRELNEELELKDYVEFTGYIEDEKMLRYLSTADICVDPDPSSPLNDVSTWIKIMEYMAMGKPIVTFDLKETHFSAQDAAVYVTPNDEGAFADALIELMDDPARRREMGDFGRKRVDEELQWSVVSRNLLAAYQSLDI